jgi:hypothetical protein
VEVYAEFDDHNFVIERLYRGSIINYRTWFMDEQAKVYLRFEKNSIVQELKIDVMNTLCGIHKTDLEEKFLRYQTKISKENKPYPLDYIMNLPPEHRNKNLSK